MLIELSRQQLCAALGISESTVRRLELQGLPYTPVGLCGNATTWPSAKRG